MALIVGIDEAGFGPVLGPLVVTGVVVVVPDQQATTCLWDLLRETCARRTSRRDTRLTVADSKKLHRGGEDLTLLERAALVTLATAGLAPPSWRSLLAMIAPTAVSDLVEYPWYQADILLPTSPSIGDVPTRSNALRRDAQSHGVQFAGFICEPLWEGHFNRLADRMRNKSNILVGQVLRIVRRAITAYRETAVHVLVDRLGGRTHYRETLQTEFEGTSIQVLEESETLSAYRIGDGSRTIAFEFAVEGESRHFPIALASVFSKYVRELSMRVFNEHWSRHDPRLGPTAGYYTDAQRWLQDAEPMLQRLGINRRMLIRER